MKRLLILASAFILTACVLEDDEDSEATFLEGTWLGPCEDYSEDGTEFGQSTVTFAGATVISVNRTYNSTTCEGDTYTSVQTAKSNLVVGDEVVLASGETVTKISFEFSEIRIRYNVQSEVAGYNATSECGFTDWEVGVEKDILSCNLGTDTIALDIALVDGDKLYFGEYVESGYPTALEADSQTRL